jgi:methionine synthase II (cobalamin-independent)
MLHDFNFKATGIGSVPFLDIEGTCRRILSQLPEIPFWPQLVKRSLFEDMSVQYSEGLPLLKIDEKKRALVCENRHIESGLTEFYEKYLAEQVDNFSISEAYAPGFYRMLESIGEVPDTTGTYIKGQSVGPVTFASGIAGPDGKSILYNPDILDAMVKGLSIKALWQVQELARTGRKTILFLDEPVLSGFGSAFSAIQRGEVIRLIQEVIQYLRERSETLIGIHCCGNTDWSMIIETGPDIINFDAFGYMDYFLLYPKELTAFLKGGGVIAWGIVPTAGFSENETVDGLYGKMEEGLNRIYDWGVTEETLAGQSILTPACGMGSMEESSADHALELLTRLGQKFNP